MWGILGSKLLQCLYCVYLRSNPIQGPVELNKRAFQVYDRLVSAVGRVGNQSARPKYIIAKTRSKQASTIRSVFTAFMYCDKRCKTLVNIMHMSRHAVPNIVLTLLMTNFVKVLRVFGFICLQNMSLWVRMKNQRKWGGNLPLVKQTE